jgi:uncharacterized protein (TIGR03382 family)
VTLTAQTWGSVAVASLDFYLDQTKLGSVNPPGDTLSVDFSQQPDGPHTLAVIATDLNGINVVSPGVTVTVGGSQLTGGCQAAPGAVTFPVALLALGLGVALRRRTRKIPSSRVVTCYESRSRGGSS